MSKTVGILGLVFVEIIIAICIVLTLKAKLLWNPFLCREYSFHDKCVWHSSFCNH